MWVCFLLPVPGVWCLFLGWGFPSHLGKINLNPKPAHSTGLEFDLPWVTLFFPTQLSNVYLCCFTVYGWSSLVPSLKLQVLGKRLNSRCEMTAPILSGSYKLQTWFLGAVSSVRRQKAAVASAQTYCPGFDFYVFLAQKRFSPFFSHAYKFYNKGLVGDGSILSIIFIVLEGRHTICIPTCSWNPPTSYPDCGCKHSPQYIKGLSIF